MAKSPVQYSILAQSKTPSWHRAQSRYLSWHRAQSKTGPWHRGESKTHRSYQRHKVQDVLNSILYGPQSRSQPRNKIYSPGPSSRDLVWYSNVWYQYTQAHQKGQVAGSRTARTPEAEFLGVIETKVLRFSSLLFSVTAANGFYPPPHSLSKSDLKLACNVNKVYQNLKSLIKLKIVPRNFSEILRPVI